jgi:hypothetical protein
LKQLQTGHPDKLIIQYIREIEDSKVFKMEKQIHQTLKFYKARNEWFDISVSDAILDMDFHFIRFEESL